MYGYEQDLLVKDISIGMPSFGPFRAIIFFQLGKEKRVENMHGHFTILLSVVRIVSTRSMREVR